MALKLIYLSNFQKYFFIAVVVKTTNIYKINKFTNTTEMTYIPSAQLIKLTLYSLMRWVIVLDNGLSSTWSQAISCTRAMYIINTLRPRQNGRHFVDDTFKSIFLNENVRILIKFSLKFVPKGPINNIPALVQIMAWRRPGAKPLSEPVMVSLLTHICTTRSQ